MYEQFPLEYQVTRNRRHGSNPGRIPVSLLEYERCLSGHIYPEKDQIEETFELSFDWHYGTETFEFQSTLEAKEYLQEFISTFKCKVSKVKIKAITKIIHCVALALPGDPDAVHSGDQSEQALSALRECLQFNVELGTIDSAYAEAYHSRFKEEPEIEERVIPSVIIKEIRRMEDVGSFLADTEKDAKSYRNKNGELYAPERWKKAGNKFKSSLTTEMTFDSFVLGLALAQLGKKSRKLESTKEYWGAYAENIITSIEEQRLTEP